MHPIADLLLDWYQDNARHLPWRATHDPYAIWVSEIMLQQTRVETVMPYYQRWMEHFPTIESLAQADLDEVLNLWEGLGYYRRARYLHRAAQQVVQNHNAQLPREQQALRELPGIGEYTAAAIGSIAFDHDAIALDGNLKRVLARLFDVQLDIQSAEAKKRLTEAALAVLPAGRAADFNQALMDLGATICTPQNPNCAACPLADHCLAFHRGLQDQLPVRRRRGDLPTVQRAAAVLSKGDKLLLGRRPPSGLLADLWEFPGLDTKEAANPLDQLSEWLDQIIGVKGQAWQAGTAYQHSYSHFKVNVQTYHGDWLSGQPEPRAHGEIGWFALEELADLPMGKVDRAIAQSLTADNQ